MKPDKKTDRRTFLKTGLIAGGVIAGAGLGIKAVADATSDPDTEPLPPPASPKPSAVRVAPPASTVKRPNILVIMVDQLRFPQWFGPIPGGGVSLPPNLQRLRQGAVSFGRHYTVSNDCTPSRSAMLTGLYTHQTGCMITGGSTLDPGFPTWGTMLREHGYQTRWYGKWHLTHHDNKWSQAQGRPLLEDYGFA
ncbi:MAG: sulfatase-like hydrolase/transferase, partial [Solirubrobacteraceae bacterium]